MKKKEKKCLTLKKNYIGNFIKWIWKFIILMIKLLKISIIYDIDNNKWVAYKLGLHYL